MKKLLLSCLLLTTLCSCAHVISPENRKDALSNGSLNEIRSHADRYAEKTFIFGGVIADTSATASGSEIEILQMPLDEWGYISSYDRSEGRFIVTAKNHLDPLIFSKGREVTVSGVFIGMRAQMLGNRDYDYPVFRAKEIHLLTRKAYYSDPYFGYDQPYYPYPYYIYNPFMFRPSLYFHYRR